MMLFQQAKQKAHVTKSKKDFFMELKDLEADQGRFGKNKKSDAKGKKKKEFFHSYILAK